MQTTYNQGGHNFWVAGVHYKKTDTCTRGMFAINPAQYNDILSLAAIKGIKEMFIISTCNRTEIYGLADDVHQLTDLVCRVSGGDQF